MTGYPAPTADGSGKHKPAVKGRRPVLLVLVTAIAPAVLAGPQTRPEPPAPEPASQPVAYAELLGAMRAEPGYDARKTTNLARFQAGVLLRLAEQAHARRPDGPPLFVGHADWFRAYLQTVGLSPAQASISVRLSFENRQDVWAEYRRDRVIRRVVEGPPVRLALNVWVAPSPGRPLPDRYSYDDLDSSPHLHVTVEREYRYHLVDFGDQVLFDQFQGLHGRPTSGLLALLFRLIGEGHLVYSRIAVADDQVQVVVGQARKAFLSKTATVTIQPDGTADAGVPKDRPDLVALEKRLQAPIEIEYVPWPE